MATSERSHSDAKKLRIVVVGAGIVGASIAYHLSRRKDVAVTVLERDEPCNGSVGTLLRVAEFLR